MIDLSALILATSDLLSGLRDPAALVALVAIVALAVLGFALYVLHTAIEKR
jgi:hypothetical protein